MKRELFVAVVSIELAVIALLVFHGSEITLIGIDRADTDVERDYREELEYRNYSEVREKDIRILALGDSFTAGYMLESREYSWPDLLEDRLVSEGRNAEVINLGEPGTGIEDHAEKFISRGYLYEPNILMIQVNRGDYYDYDRLETRVSKRLREENLTDASRERKREIRRRIWESFVEEEESKSKSYKIDRFRRNLDIISERTTPGTEVYLIYMPRTPNSYSPEEFLRSYASREGWNFIDGRKFYRGVDEEDIRIAPDDPHFNRYGNRIWAREIHEEIEDDLLELSSGNQSR